MARDEEIEQIKNRLRDLIDRDISSKGSQILGKDNLIRIGKFVKTKRMANGWTVMRFQHICWISHDIITKIENGENVKMESLFRVLHKLGYTLSVKRSGTGYAVEIREWSYFG